MTIVDANTLADFFNGVEAPQVRRLDAALLSPDRDFEQIARHTQLRLVRG